MEAVKTVLTRLKLPSGRGAVLYIVQMESYPKSFRIKDASPSVAVFAVLGSGWNLDRKVAAVRETIRDFLPHEWAHHALSLRYGRRSPGRRARWIEEGFASYVADRAMEMLEPGRFSLGRRLRLPLVDLHRLGPEALLAWEYEPIPARLDQMPSLQLRYSASMGVFLGIEERGGPEAVLAFLDAVKGRGELSAEEIDSALGSTSGTRLSALAAMSAEELQSVYDLALRLLASAADEEVSVAVEALERFPERFGSHGEAVRKAAGSDVLSPVTRAAAQRLIEEQGSP
ncbi:MAG TPA: hypothetical protein VJV23_07505 [Candidatus Polarisedimenticolia bacterium]|nr:hypothetical protein [Candidatus Polarisedimenticolia bacterium]